MTNDLLWLSVSLFCKKEHWHTLLRKGIEPFVNLQSTNILLHYTIEFNYLGGENTRLSLLTRAGDAETMAQRVDEYFKAYFSTAGFPVAQTTLPVQGVFLPFPSNSVQYGLYEPVRISDASLHRYNTAIQLSGVMAAALKEDEIDDDTLITFAFYLNTTLLKVAMIHTKEPAMQLLSCYTNEGASGNFTRDIIDTKFEDNKTMLREIAQDIFCKREDLPQWLNTWQAACNKAFAETQLVAPLIVNRVAYTISKQLGFSESATILLNHFIQQVHANLVAIQNEDSYTGSVIR